MREKKVRGRYRKAVNTAKNILASTKHFPKESDFHNNIWNLPIPTDQKFIESSKTPQDIKRFCIQIMLDAQSNLMQMKPDDNEKYRVVVAFKPTNLWDSQIIIFKGETAFKDFFNKYNNLSYETITGYTPKWNFVLTKGVQTKVYKGISRVTYFEEIVTESDIWFIGELD